jgi:hypothetical protein
LRVVGDRFGRGFKKASRGRHMVGPGLEAFILAAALRRAAAESDAPKPRAARPLARPRRLDDGPVILGWRPISPPQK